MNFMDRVDVARTWESHGPEATEIEKDSIVTFKREMYVSETKATKKWNSVDCLSFV